MPSASRVVRPRASSNRTIRWPSGGVQRPTSSGSAESRKVTPDEMMAKRVPPREVDRCSPWTLEIGGVPPAQVWVPTAAAGADERARRRWWRREACRRSGGPAPNPHGGEVGGGVEHHGVLVGVVGGQEAPAVGREQDGAREVRQPFDALAASVEHQRPLRRRRVGEGDVAAVGRHGQRGGSRRLAHDSFHAGKSRHTIGRSATPVSAGGMSARGRRWRARAACCRGRARARRRGPSAGSTKISRPSTLRVGRPTAVEQQGEGLVLDRRRCGPSGRRTASRPGRTSRS